MLQGGLRGGSQEDVSGGRLGGGLWGDFRGKAQVEVSGGSSKFLLIYSKSVP